MMRQIGSLDVDADQVIPFYDAVRRLLDILYDDELRITLPLKSGEGLLFNIKRILVYLVRNTVTFSEST